VSVVKFPGPPEEPPKTYGYPPVHVEAPVTWDISQGENGKVILTIPKADDPEMIVFIHGYEAVPAERFWQHWRYWPWAWIASGLMLAAIAWLWWDHVG